MDSVELLNRTERFALDSLAFYRKLPKSAEAQVPGVQFYRAANIFLVELSSLKTRKVEALGCPHCSGPSTNQILDSRF